MHRPRSASLPMLLALALPLAACGWDDYDPDGNVIVQNFTDESPDPEAVVSFHLARFGEPWTGNLLSGPLPPGSSEYIGSFHEDYYDAEADTELGGLVEWFDTWIFAGEDNFFDVY